MKNRNDQYFKKRIYDPHSFQADIRRALKNMGDFREAHRAGRVDQAFAERIMLAVTRVNGCRYCAFGHARAALQSGVSQEEVNQLTSGEWETLPLEQVPALLFAQHYADSGGQPDAAAWDRLVEVYGEKTAQDILANIHMITIGNLLGNTFDALISRFGGKPAQNSSFWKEVRVLFGVFTIPFYGFVSKIKNLAAFSAAGMTP
jgi:AhpD family alkylhydroperoxidase